MTNDYTLPLDKQKAIAWAALRNYARALKIAGDTQGIIELRNGLRGFEGILIPHKRKA